MSQIDKQVTDRHIAGRQAAQRKPDKFLVCASDKRRQSLSLGRSSREDGVDAAAREERNLFRAIFQAHDQHFIRSETVLGNCFQLLLPGLLHVGRAQHGALDGIEEDVGNRFPDAVSPTSNIITRC